MLFYISEQILYQEGEIAGRNWATKVEIEQFFHVCHFEFFEAWAFFLGRPKLRWYTVIMIPIVHLVNTWYSFKH